MDVGKVRGHVDAAVPVGCGQGELVVVLIDGAAHGAEGVVAVGQHIGQGELGHAGGPGGLDDAHIGDVVGGHGVEFQPEVVHVGALVVAFQNAIGHGALLGCLFRNLLAGLGGNLGGVSDQVSAVYQVNAGIVQTNHWEIFLSKYVLNRSNGILLGKTGFVK